MLLDPNKFELGKFVFQIHSFIYFRSYASNRVISRGNTAFELRIFAQKSDWDGFFFILHFLVTAAKNASLKMYYSICYSRVFGVAEHEYDMKISLQHTWCPGWPVYLGHLLEYLKIWFKMNLFFFSEVFGVAENKCHT